jgi:hypothetical protein
MWCIWASYGWQARISQPGFKLMLWTSCEREYRDNITLLTWPVTPAQLRSIWRVPWPLVQRWKQCRQFQTDRTAQNSAGYHLSICRIQLALHIKSVLFIHFLALHCILLRSALGLFKQCTLNCQTGFKFCFVERWPATHCCRWHSHLCPSRVAISDLILCPSSTCPPLIIHLTMWDYRNALLLI